MVSQNQLKSLSKFTSASWAIWCNDFKTNTTRKTDKEIYGFMLNNIKKLKSGTVFLGLNPSKGKDKEAKPHRIFGGFHSEGHAGDKNLVSFIQDQKCANLIGSYMTDINSRVIEADSAKVDVDSLDFQEFLAQLKILGNKHFNIICFGSKVFNLLTGYLGISKNGNHTSDLKILHKNVHAKGLEVDVYRVWHYSNRGYNSKNVKQLQDQLKYLNSHIV